MGVVARPIERPGVTIHMSLARVLNLTPDSPAAIEWQERMADLDRHTSVTVRTEDTNA